MIPDNNSSYFPDNFSITELKSNSKPSNPNSTGLPREYRQIQKRKIEQKQKGSIGLSVGLESTLNKINGAVLSRGNLYSETQSETQRSKRATPMKSATVNMNLIFKKSLNNLEGLAPEINQNTTGTQQESNVEVERFQPKAPALHPERRSENDSTIPAERILTHSETKIRENSIHENSDLEEPGNQEERASGETAKDDWGGWSFVETKSSEVQTTESPQETSDEESFAIESFTELSKEWENHQNLIAAFDKKFTTFNTTLSVLKERGLSLDELLMVQCENLENSFNIHKTAFTTAFEQFNVLLESIKGEDSSLDEEGRLHFKNLFDIQTEQLEQYGNQIDEYSNSLYSLKDTLSKMISPELSEKIQTDSKRKIERDIKKIKDQFFNKIPKFESAKLSRRNVINLSDTTPLELTHSLIIFNNKIRRLLHEKDLFEGTRAVFADQNAKIGEGAFKKIKGLANESGQITEVLGVIKNNTNKEFLEQAILSSKTFRDAKYLLSSHHITYTSATTGLEKHGFISPYMESGDITNSDLTQDKRAALSACLQIAQGVKEMHEKGWAHFDIKPENVMHVYDPSKPGQIEACLGDLDLALPGDAEYGLRGTPEFMSPQMARRECAGPEAAKQNDIYALGLTLYQIYTQKDFFENPPKPSELKSLTRDTMNFKEPANPNSFEHLIWEMVDPEYPEKRPSIDEVVKRLRGYQLPS